MSRGDTPNRSLLEGAQELKEDRDQASCIKKWGEHLRGGNDKSSGPVMFMHVSKKKILCVMANRWSTFHSSASVVCTTPKMPSP